MNDPRVKAFRVQHHREFLGKVAESKRFPWGEAVDGASARLRADRIEWPTNRAVRLSADIRNLGERTAFVIRSAMAHQLEVDGQRYRVRTGGGKSSPLYPQKIYTNINMELRSNWVAVKDGKPLELGIGLVAGSDAHRPEQVGRYFDRLPEFLSSL